MPEPFTVFQIIERRYALFSCIFQAFQDFARLELDSAVSAIEQSLDVNRPFARQDGNHVVTYG